MPGASGGGEVMKASVFNILRVSKTRSDLVLSNFGKAV